MSTFSRPIAAGAMLAAAIIASGSPLIGGIALARGSTPAHGNGAAQAIVSGPTHSIPSSIITITPVTQGATPVTTGACPASTSGTLMLAEAAAMAPASSAGCQFTPAPAPVVVAGPPSSTDCDPSVLDYIDLSVGLVCGSSAAGGAPQLGQLGTSGGRIIPAAVRSYYGEPFFVLDAINAGPPKNKK